MNGLKVKELRKKSGIGQAELSRRAGVSQACISGIETGRFSGSPETMKAIAEVLNCRIAEIDGTLSEYDKLVMRCRFLSHAQLMALNELVLQFVELSLTKVKEEEQTATTSPGATSLCSSCVRGLRHGCVVRYQENTVVKCDDYKASERMYG